MRENEHATPRHWKTSPATCPHCGNTINGVAVDPENGEAGKMAPEPGMIAICHHCPHISRINAAGVLEKIPDKERSALMAGPYGPQIMAARLMMLAVQVRRAIMGDES